MVQDGQGSAINRDFTVFGCKLGWPTAMNGVEFQQMSVHFRIACFVIDPSDLGAAFQERSQGQLADTAKTIQCVGCHHMSFGG